MRHRNAIVSVAIFALAIMVAMGAVLPGRAAPASQPGFQVWERVNCSPALTVGVPTTCTIGEGIINSSSHVLSFAHTVVNRLSGAVHIVSVSTSSGSIAVVGSTVVWKGFTVPPGRRATASIQVSFTPSGTLAGTAVVLSNGIQADGVDAVTGKRLSMSFGALRTPAEVARPAGGSNPATRGSPPPPSRMPVTGGAAS